jgi:uncharacterized protein YecT (DUF1311 family)
MRKENSKALLTIFIFVIIILLAACENSSAKSDNNGNNKSPDHTSDEEIHDSSEENVTETVSNKEMDTKEETEKTSDQLPEEKEETTANDTTTNQKETYLNKLNETNEKTESMEAVDSSTYALKDVAHKQYEAWDDLLNEIYGVLEKQLSAEEMSQLREEQRDWITHRDKTAKEASLEYEGGTMEQLEYVTVLANETKERCYELVEVYMQ